MEEEHIVVKLAKMRNELWRNRKKAGYYDFTSEFDLSKLLPVISRLEAKYGLACIICTDNNRGEMIISDGDDETCFMVPFDRNVWKMRTQLYMIAFGIPDTGWNYDHIAEIRNMLNVNGVTEKGMLDYYKVDSLEHMSLEQWTDAMEMLRKQKGKKKDKPDV